MDNVVAVALNHILMGSVAQVLNDKKNLVKEVHRLAQLGVRLEDSPNGGSIVHDNSESSFVVEVNSKKHLECSIDGIEGVSAQ